MTTHRAVSKSEYTAGCQYVTGGHCHWHEESHQVGEMLRDKLSTGGIGLAWEHLEKYFVEEVLR